MKQPEGLSFVFTCEDAVVFPLNLTVMKTKTPLLRLLCLMLMSTALGSFWGQNALAEERLFSEVKEDRSSQALVLEAVRQAHDAVALSLDPSALETLRMQDVNGLSLIHI